MNESKSNVPNMYQTIPAVAALNRVPGFEPMKLLRPAKSRKSNERVLKLALPYKKLWFLLAHPKGRIMVNRLKITEKMAIYEAQVYLDRSDTEPISNFTACCMFNSETNNNFVKEAQEEAINEALSLAGFGLQFADVEMTKEDERFGSEIPLSAVLKQTQVETPVMVPSAAPVQQKTQPSAGPAEVKQPVQPAEENELPIAPAMENKGVAEQSEDVLPIAPVENTVEEEMKLPVEEVQPVQSNEPVQAKESREGLSATQRAMQILQGRATVSSAQSVTPAAAVKTEESKEEEFPKYTKSTPVPEILKIMTMEEAEKVVVDVGICKDKTILEVANTRPAVLKYYQFGGYKGGNNILIAAATKMYNHLESQKMEKAG